MVEKLAGYCHIVIPAKAGIQFPAYRKVLFRQCYSVILLTSLLLPVVVSHNAPIS